MPLVPIPNAYIITVDITQAGQPSQVVLGFEANEGIFVTKEDAQTALGAFWSAFRTVIAADCTCTGGSFSDQEVNPIVEELTAPPSPTGASTVGTTSVAAYAALVKWSTAQGGRRGKGRTFVPGVPKDAIAVGGRTFVSGYTTAVGTAIDSYLNNAIFSGFGPAVISRKYSLASRITSGALAPVPGIQRRRMR